MDDIEKILKQAGYRTVSGAKAVQKAIKKSARGPSAPLCSGFRVFPDGTKCNGCPDCEDKK